jgi:NAD(P)-dependent dehydrogenase (short-subunit alcohol dehydrogenase family)
VCSIGAGGGRALDDPAPRRCIVNVASMAGVVGVPNAAPYVASTRGVVGLTKALAIDWGQYGIRVNALCPGMTVSNLSQADRAKNPQMFVERERRVPLAYSAQPEEQAHAILFLASAEARYAHGLIMNLDGGPTALSSGHSAPRDPG